MVDHDTLELLKGGRLFTLLAYMIYSDRKDRTEDRVADIKRSEATSLLATSVNKIMDYLNSRHRKEE